MSSHTAVPVSLVEVDLRSQLEQQVEDGAIRFKTGRFGSSILELLENCDQRHVSAEDVYRMLIEANEDIGLATVYRVLTQFEKAGLIERHHFEDGYSVFELNRGGQHDHIICVSCGRVEEFGGGASAHFPKVVGTFSIKCAMISGTPIPSASAR